MRGLLFTNWGYSLSIEHHKLSVGGYAVRPWKAICVVLFVVLLTCPILADDLTLHAGKDTLTKARILRIEHLRIVIGHQTGIGTYELSAFPKTEQALIHQELNISTAKYAKMQDQAIAEKQMIERQQLLQKQAAAELVEAKMRKEAEQAAYEKDQESKGLVKIDGKWAKKVKCDDCNGHGGRTVSYPARWVVDDCGPISPNGTHFMGNKRVLVPAGSSYRECYKCKGRGFSLIGEDGVTIETPSPQEAACNNERNAGSTLSSLATSTETSKLQCPSCKGSGRCSNCGGTGITKGKKANEIGASCILCMRSKYNKYLCRYCNGSGYIKGAAVSSQAEHIAQNQDNNQMHSHLTSGTTGQQTAQTDSTSGNIGNVPSMGHRNPWGQAGGRVVGTYPSFDAAYRACGGSSTPILERWKNRS